MKKKLGEKDLKKPTIKIDRSLNQYRGKVIFPRTLAKALRLLNNLKSPERFLKEDDKSA